MKQWRRLVGQGTIRFDRVWLDTHAQQWHITYDGATGGCVLNYLADEEMPLEQSEMSVLFLQWLRSTDKETQMKVFASIVLEYQVSAHINTKTEEDHLAALNMQQDDVIPEILQAVRTVAFVDHERHVVRVADVTAYLTSQSLLLLPYVVLTVMKTIEECVPGNCRQVDGDLFELSNNF